MAHRHEAVAAPVPRSRESDTERLRISVDGQQPVHVAGDCR